MSKIYTMGELLVEIMRDKEDKPLNIPEVFKGPYPSGAPAIFISTAARLGQQTKMWGGVGKDKFGQNLLDRLRGVGVDCSDVVEIENGSTAVAFVSYDSAGEREFIFHIANTPADKLTFTQDSADIPDYFHVMGCSLMVSDHMYSQIISAVKFFAENGAKITFDPNLRPELLGNRSIWDVAGTIIENCSIFLPGVAELKAFTSSESVEGSIAELFEKFSKMEIIFLKNGSKGAIIYTRNEKIEIPVYPISEVCEIVDPTGAGDSFDAAFISGLADGMSLTDAGKYAAKAGAINAIAFGPMEGNMQDMDKNFFA